MKKVITILCISISLMSCQKENIEKTKHYVSFVGDIDNGYCKINGKVCQTASSLDGKPIYECYTGDVLEYVDNGIDQTYAPVYMYPIGGGTPTLLSPGGVNQGYTNGYIVVDTQIVKQYEGNGDAHLTYTIK